MRVALVICGELSQATGGFLYDRLLLAELEHMGVKVEVISIPWRRYVRQLADNFDRVWRDRLRALEADIVLQDELCHPALVGLNRSALTGKSTPLIAIVHHLRSCERHAAPLSILYRWLERSYLATLDGFIFNSRHTRDSTLELLGEARPAVVAYPGRNDLVPGPPPTRARNAPQLLFVGGLTPRKGLHTLLQALRALSDEDWRLHVVGREDLNPEYARRMKLEARRFRPLGRIEFHGHLAQPALTEHYRSADVLAVPSRLEGFGMVYLEAMGFGLAVIASAHGGAAELIDHGQNGLLVRPEAPQELAAALRPLLRDPELRDALGRSARRRYQEHPTWQQTARDALMFMQSFTRREEAGSHDAMSAATQP